MISAGFCLLAIAGCEFIELPSIGEVNAEHHVSGNRMFAAWPEGMEEAVLGTVTNFITHNYDGTFEGMGCFWGAERLFWKQEGVYSTQVGYAGGTTEFPTYAELKEENKGRHAEVVRVVFDPLKINYNELLQLFFENHDPTQGFFFFYKF